MKTKIQHEIQEYCSLLRLNAISEHLEEAIASATDYEEFLHQLLHVEVDAEEERARERKIKAAKFPYRKYILKWIFSRKECENACRSCVRWILSEKEKTSL